MKVLITKEKLDSLAATISVKAGASLPLSIDEMVSAVQSIQNTSTPSLQAKTAVPSSAQFTVTADSNYDGLSSVTVAAITPTYIGIGIATRSANNVVISGRNVTVSSGYYPNNVSKTVTTATYSIQYDQTFGSNNTKVNTIYSVNDFQQGYITTLAITPAEQTVISQTFTPSTVTQTYTQNDTGSFLRTVVVEPIPNTGIEIPSTTNQTQINTKTKTLTASATSIQFTGLEAEPSSFVIISFTNQTTGGTKVASVAYDGISLYGMDITTQAQSDENFTYSYSSGTLTVTATSASFQANEYKLVYSYGGTPENDVDAKDVQVGSGATSITFTGLKGEPSYFSCVFKSNFSTSNGYQRVISVVYDGTNTYGLAMGSSAIAASSWTYTYNNGTLTITSQGTNNGGYFHQPGYYQLTYAMGVNSNGQSMKITPSTSEQLVYADEGHTLDMVLVEAIPSNYVVPTGTLTITPGMSGTINVSQYAFISL